MSLSAAQEAIRAARWNDRQLSDDQTALIVGTSKGPIENWMTAPPGFAYRTNDVSFDPIGLHEISQALARGLRLGCGPRATYSAACASGLHALIQATMLIRSGIVSRALVVAAEASVHPLFVGSFKRLGVLPPEGFGCRPFDQDRSGFLMSESAGAVCLESGDESTSRILARIDRFALGGDATHLTGVDPRGATLRRLLKHVIDDRQVDLIHAHATGTEMNDPIELAAIEDLLPASDRPTWLYSHKGALGHSLGAAGLVSVVLNLQSHRHGVTPPNIATQNPMPTRHVQLNREAAKASVRRSLAIATGFGGPTAVVSCISA
jgi:3-oxoacyl-[acyl-carrier-protein] synthase II